MNTKKEFTTQQTLATRYCIGTHFDIFIIIEYLNLL